MDQVALPRAPETEGLLHPISPQIRLVANILKSFLEESHSSSWSLLQPYPEKGSGKHVGVDFLALRPKQSNHKAPHVYIM